MLPISQGGQAYLQVKYMTDLQLKCEFYRQKRYRQRKWITFINTQRSESLMLNRFEEKFDPPDKVVIGFGDWDQVNHNK